MSVQYTFPEYLLSKKRGRFSPTFVHNGGYKWIVYAITTTLSFFSRLMLLILTTFVD